jgi:hypothetical protein
VYAAYGGVYVVVALAWLWLVDGVRGRQLFERQSFSKLIYLLQLLTNVSSKLILGIIAISLTMRFDMKINYLLVLLFLGVSLNASANNGGDQSSWSNPPSHDVLHEVIGLHGDSIGDCFGSDSDQATHDIGSISGNLKDLFGDLKDHWRWDKSPFCDWPPVVSSVPEPDTYAMMPAGLGMMGWIAGRRKQQARQ